MIILTGFLGAGKTTVLNRVLAAPPVRIAVVVNELGRIDVDGKLLRARSGDVMELVGGCVCHEITTQEELWEGLRDILGRSRPDVVVLETTGIAEPRPILQGLASLSEEDRMVEIAAVVTVVEAEAGLRQLETHEEARQQVKDADRIVISKLDLAGDGALTALHARLGWLNPGAERASFPATDEGTLELASYLLRKGTRTDRVAESAHHHHDRQLIAASFVEDAPLFADPLLAVAQRLGPQVARVKGFVNIAGEPRRAFLERAGDRTTLRYGDPWGRDVPRTEIVLIGEGLDPSAIRRQLWACRQLRAAP
jgi:G3E family GTPase